MVSTATPSSTGNQNFNVKPTEQLVDSPEKFSSQFYDNGRILTKRQNYSPFRTADPTNSLDTDIGPFIFLKKHKEFSNTMLKSYSEIKANVETRTDIQDYCRYRDANYRRHSKSSLACDTRLSHLSHSSNKSTEDEYSRYRNAQCTRSNSVPPTPSKIIIHYNCRNAKYDSEAQRFPVPDQFVPWSVDFPDYQPVEYTTKKILKNPKADSSDPSTIKHFNDIDDKIDRTSFTGVYFIDPITKRPRNPVGRTGMTGRGRLYHWGPNHAGDPVVTRWKRDNNGLIVHKQSDPYSGLKPVLEFVAIQRRDSKQWALPGGMVDPGEHISQTVAREFEEEAGRLSIDKKLISRLFSNGHKLRECYVDDPRNTDNAWMETIAMHFHDENGYLTKDLNLHAGDDAEQVVWCTIDRTLQLYACHKDIIYDAVQRLHAYW